MPRRRHPPTDDELLTEAFILAMANGDDLPKPVAEPLAEHVCSSSCRHPPIAEPPYDEPAGEELMGFRFTGTVGR